MIYPFRKTVFDCKQATLLSIKREEGKITLFERMKLSYHLFYCGPCRRFIRQWQIIGRMGRALRSSPPPFSLTEAAKTKLQKITGDL